MSSEFSDLLTGGKSSFFDGYTGQKIRGMHPATGSLAVGGGSVSWNTLTLDDQSTAFGQGNGSSIFDDTSFIEVRPTRTAAGIKKAETDAFAVKGIERPVHDEYQLAQMGVPRRRNAGKRRPSRPGRDLKGPRSTEGGPGEWVSSTYGPGDHDQTSGFVSEAM